MSSRNSSQKSKIRSTRSKHFLCLSLRKINQIFSLSETGDACPVIGHSFVFPLCQRFSNVGLRKSTEALRTTVGGSGSFLSEAISLLIAWHTLMPRHPHQISPVVL